MRTSLPFSAIKRALSERLDDEARHETSLQEEHRLVELLLEQLEALADGLPDLPPAAAIDWLIQNLRDGVPAHCRQEEEALQTLGSPQALRAIELLAVEHAENAAVGAELADVLEDCRADCAVQHPEALGQLARQYFMLMRRHIVWEEYLMEALQAEAPPS